ncbi:DUF2955 domain-containing protein [Ferrimonas sp. YFM]|uniref:DUF2955 domain-containing protein n=1 Tax=Ferrimonas sp. YFM TaxID=3028878 RepID=UPI0025741A3C|nr:DUF2955 domain-containing protein [Ferrimonas sp. YFM]BDY05168.1 hypothetical protein F0521_22090 [Ferrimonas sp. YFM]
MLKRLWAGCALAFVMATLGDWRFGAMFAPIFVLVILSRIHHWHTPAMVQLLFSVSFSGALANLLLGFLQGHPVLLLCAMALWMAISCWLLIHPMTFMFGFVNIILGSMLMNLGSFPQFDILDYSLDLGFSALVAVIISALMWRCFPSEAVPAQAQPPQESQQQILINLVSTWLMVMLLYLMFQLMELSDSISAQVAALLMLSQLNLMTSFIAARARLIGTLLGAGAALLLQLLLFTWVDHALLYLLAFALLLGPFVKLVCQGGERSAIGFAGVSSLVVLMSGVIPGQRDLVYASLYRLGSTVMLICLATLLLLLTHTLTKQLLMHSYSGQR